MEEVYAIPPRVALPEAGSWVYMIVTGVHSANRFMGHILGPIDHSGMLHVMTLHLLLTKVLV